MFATFFSVALFAASALTGLVAAEPTIHTPTEVTQCKGVKLTWEKAVGKVNIIAVNAADPCGPVVADIGDLDGDSFTWTPKLKAGQKIQLSLEDESGEESWTGAFTIAAGDQSCLPNELKSGPSSSAPSAPLPTTGPTGPTGPTDSPDEEIVPVGAAGTGPVSGALNGASASHISLPLLAVSAAFGALFLL